MNVLFVHGYSETSLGAYFNLPERLRTALPSIDRIALAAFNSLDDTVTIDDLADAMETRIARMEADAANPWSTSNSAVICHSTGALVARRWILNRLVTGKPLPSHLVTMAGANHGSTLAQLGKSVFGYVQKMLLKRMTTVGAQVLTDLDYGSDFLLRLNREWLEKSNDGGLDALWTFSMGGDSVGPDPSLQLFWQTHECGSDNTVRISGANLNYAMIDASHGDGQEVVVRVLKPNRPVPHLILKSYSHFGNASGILGWVDPNGDRAVSALVAALGVTNLDQYRAVQAVWQGVVQNWMADKRAARAGASGTSDVNATVVWTIRDESGRSIDDCVIAILDGEQLGDIANAMALESQVIALVL